MPKHFTGLSALYVYGLASHPRFSIGQSGARNDGSSSWAIHLSANFLSFESRACRAACAAHP
ncbi:Uncharacterised protein [Vibrio cholerae]|nr:Uncharacterised protein [Vibrio cholerae]CSI71993.1 Uncharacterised protein [Vibrio cholerae]